MTNTYYNVSGVPGSGAPGASSPIRSEFAAIAAGFAKLPNFSPTVGGVLSLAASFSGSVTVAPGGSYPYVQFGLTETVTSLAASTQVSALTVNQSFSGGEASRCTGNFYLTNTGPTAHSGVGGNHAFYSPLNTSNWIASGDGGSIGNYLGDFYGLTTIVTATAAATYLHSVIGYEPDVSVVAGASVLQKVNLQVATVNDDAVQGGLGVDGGADMAISILGDPSTTALWRYGLCFGRAGARFNVGGTLIGWEPYSINTPAPAKAMDFSGLTFSGDMVDLGGTAAVPFFKILANGSVVVNGSAVTSKSITNKSGFPQLVMNDLGSTATVTNGGLIRFSGLGTGDYEFQTNTAVAGDFNTVLQSMTIKGSDGTVTFNIGAATDQLKVGTPTSGYLGTGTINIDHAYYINNQKVMDAPITGWGTSSNGTRAAVNGSTATLPQVAAAVAQLLVDLKALGPLRT